MVVSSSQIILPGIDTGTALVRDRATRIPVRRDTEQIQRRSNQRTPQRAEDDPKRRQTATAGPRLGTSDALRRAPTADAQRWKQQIPPNAMFYDEVGDIADGIGQPGLMVSVRV